MNITKFDHSTFYIEKDGHGLLFDPVEYATGLPEFTNIDVIIITHKHGDHFQPEVLQKVLVANPNAKVFTTSDNADALSNATIVKPSDKISTDVFDLEFFGSGNHAAIYNNEIPCENVGAIIDGKIVNPGDSFDIPNLAEISVLLVPISAPWLKTEESIKYIEALRPRIAINTHDGLLSRMGLNISNNWIKQKATIADTEYKYCEPGEGLTL